MNKVYIPMMIVFLALLSNLDQVFAKESGPVAVAPPSYTLQPSEPFQQATSIDDFTHKGPVPVVHAPPVAAVMPGYDADDVIRTIRASTKKCFSKNALLIGLDLTQKIREGDSKVIKDFRRILSKLNPGKLSGCMSYNVEYYPEEDEVISHILNPK
jgi:hypothetical protein